MTVSAHNVQTVSRLAWAKCLITSDLELLNWKELYIASLSEVTVSSKCSHSTLETAKYVKENTSGAAGRTEIRTPPPVLPFAQSSKWQCELNTILIQLCSSCFWFRVLYLSHFSCLTNKIPMLIYCLFICLFKAYLTTLSVVETTQYTAWWSMNDELERKWKEAGQRT